MAGQNADMTLKVGLDLNFFKQELVKASSSLAGQPIDINIRFSKKSIGDQYNLLSRWLRAKKTFDVKIESNTLNALTDKVANFQKTLKNLEDEKVELSINASANVEKFSKEKIRKIRAQIRRDIVSGGAGEIQLPTKLAAPSISVFIKDVAKKIKEQTNATYAGGGVPIATKLTVPGITDLLKALQKNLNRNSISITTSFKESGKSEAALAKIIRSAEKTKVALGTELAPLGANEIAEFRKVIESKLSGIKIAIDTGVSKAADAPSTNFSQAQLKKIGQDIKPLYRAAADAGLVAFDEAIANNVQKIAKQLSEIGEDSIGGLLNGLKSGDAKIKAAAENLGETLISSIKGVLGIASPSREFKKIGQNVGEGFQQGMMSSMDKAFDAVEGLMRARMKVLDTIARGMFRIAGVDPAAIRAEAAQRRALPSVNFPATVPPRNTSIGPSGTGRALPAGASAAGLLGGARPPVGLLPAMSIQSQVKAVVDALVAQQGPRALPSGGGQLVDTKRIYAALRKNLDEILQRQFTVIDTEVRETSSGIKDAMGAFAYLVQALKDAEARTKDARIDDAVSSLMREIEGAIKLAQSRARIISAQVTDLGASQRMLREQRIAGFLPAAVGRAPNTYSTGAIGGETRAEMMARREREARMRSAERGAAIMGEQLALPPGIARGLGQPGFMRAPGMAPLNRPGVTGQAPVSGPSGGGPEEQAFVNAAKNALRFNEALNISRKSLDGFRASQLPLVGGLKELGGEFAFAFKQVLLFGTAYKGLAFVQSLPGQILNAAKSQQQYNNALNTATQDTGTFAKELLYVDNVQRAFGLNLQTTRDGFTKLYASMAPADFDSGSIEKLFTGISAATAALQLTPDKAERVIYAFGQMASKGQIMSEELKGQLGDVLPGALAIFAKAAGMSVKEFSKAMEDGEFVGQKFRDTFAKVSDELMTRFGTGAQAAGRSLQGLLNTVQGDFQRTLESFTPLADIAAKAILGPLALSLRQLSKAASIAFGEQERLKKQLADAREIKNNAQNIAALEARLGELNAAANDPSIAQQAKNIEDFVSQVSEAAKAVSSFASGISSIVGPILTALGTNLTSVIQTLAVLVVSFNAIKLAAIGAMGVLLTMKTIEGITMKNALATNILAGAYRLLGVQATAAQVATIGFGAAVKGLLASTGVGLLVVLLGSVAAAFLDIGNKAGQAAEKTKAAMASMQDAIRAGNVEIAKADLYSTQRQRNTLEDAVKLLDRLEQKGRKTGRGGAQVYAQTNLAERMLLEQAGLDLQGRTEVDIQQLRGQVAPLRTELKNLEQRQKVGVGLAERQRQKMGFNEPKPIKTTEDPETEADTKKTKDKKEYVSEIARIYQKELDEKLLYIEQDASLDDRSKEVQKAAISWQYEHAIAKAEYNQKISASNTKDIANLSLYLDEQKRLFEYEKKIIDARYEGIVTKPLRDLLAEERNEQIRLNASINSLAKGREEMTRLEKVQVEVSKALAPLNEEQRKSLQPLVDLLLEAAKATDELTEAEKKRVEQQKLQKRVKEGIGDLRSEIALLRAITEEEQKRLRIAQEYTGASQEQISLIYNLETVRDNIRATREIIDGFITDTSSDYKGFLKSVISGEDAADALRQFQDSLKDKVLTIFLDFTMAPVEKFFKEVVGGNLLKALFPESAEEKAAVEQANNTTALGTVTTAIQSATTAINNLTTTIGGGIGVPSSMNVAGLGASNVGNDLASQLMNERGYEDIAGLLPLPLEKMRQQAARPLRTIWQQIQGAMEGVYGMAEKEIKKTFKPNPAVHQRVMQSIQRVESLRTGPNAWNPIDAQWKERENRWREDKRSRSVPTPASAVTSIVKTLLDPIVERVNKAELQSVREAPQFGGPDYARIFSPTLGSSRDLSFMLSDNEKNIIKKTILDVFSANKPDAVSLPSQFTSKQQKVDAMNKITSYQDNMMIAADEAAQSLRAVIKNFPGFYEEVIQESRRAGDAFAEGALRNLGRFKIAPVETEQWLQEQRDRRSKQFSDIFSQPIITPGVESQFEGASLPFNMQKMTSNYGQVATAGSLGGLISGGSLLEVAGVDLESFAGNVERFKASTELLDSSMGSIVNSTYSAAEEAGPEGGTGKKWMQSLGIAVQGIGIAAGSIMGIAAGINQTKEGGFANTLGGIGMIMSSVGGLLGGFSNLAGMFGGGGGASAIVQGVDIPASALPPGMAFANGGIVNGGFIPFRAFANGGTVNGPTLGLVGEGRYNEAIVPLPNGRAIPVQINEGRSARDLMGRNAPGMAQAAPLTLKFESTKINGVEYVSRDQLEQAMAETRRASIAGGASRGMAMTLDKIQQNPSVRSRLGMR